MGKEGGEEGGSYVLLSMRSERGKEHEKGEEEFCLESGVAVVAEEEEEDVGGQGARAGMGVEEGGGEEVTLHGVEGREAAREGGWEDAVTGEEEGEDSGGGVQEGGRGRGEGGGGREGGREGGRDISLYD